MARIRTFLAIDPGKTIRGRLIALQRSFANTGAEVKWVEPENLHVTLLFLGEVNDRELLDVCRAAGEVTKQLKSFPITVAGTGCFPNPRRPRVLWAGLSQGSPETIVLHDRLEEALLKLGCYRREDREFTPHITLGRIKSDRVAVDLTAALTQHQDWVGGETTVREVHVMSSQLTPEGPIYAVLSRAKLA